MAVEPGRGLRLHVYLCPMVSYTYAGIASLGRGSATEAVTRGRVAGISCLERETRRGEGLSHGYIAFSLSTLYLCVQRSRCFLLHSTAQDILSRIEQSIATGLCSHWILLALCQFADVFGMDRACQFLTQQLSRVVGCNPVFKSGNFLGHKFTL
jgi:hypothetical protein